MTTLKELLPGIAALLAIVTGTLGLFWFAIGWDGLLGGLVFGAFIAALLVALFAVHWLLESLWFVPVVVVAVVAIGIVRRCGP